MPSAIEVYEVMTGYLTMNDLMEGFGVSELTILDWRKRKRLPYVIFPDKSRSAIRYREDQVKAWAKRRGKTFPIAKKTERVKF